MKTLNQEIIFKSFEVKKDNIVHLGEGRNFVFVDCIYFKTLEELEEDNYFDDTGTVGVLRLYNVDLGKIESYHIFSYLIEDLDTPQFLFLLDNQNEEGHVDYEEIDFLSLFNIDVREAMANQLKQPEAHVIGYYNATELTMTYFSTLYEEYPTTFNFFIKKADGEFTSFVYYDVLPEQVKFDREGNGTLTCNIFKNSYIVKNPMLHTPVFYKQMSVPVQKNADGTFDISLIIEGQQTVTIKELSNLHLIKELLVERIVEPGNLIGN